MISYEEQLDRDRDWALREGSMHFDKQNAVHKTLARLATRLDELGVDHAVAGSMAMFTHGYRRFTEDVDVLVEYFELGLLIAAETDDHVSMMGFGHELSTHYINQESADDLKRVLDVAIPAARSCMDLQEELGEEIDVYSIYLTLLDRGIDCYIDTGDYELDADERLAFLRAREARPDGIVCILRVGYRAAGRLGRSRCEPLKA